MDAMVEPPGMDARRVMLMNTVRLVFFHTSHRHHPVLELPEGLDKR